MVLRCLKPVLEPGRACKGDITKGDELVVLSPLDSSWATASTRENLLESSFTAPPRRRGQWQQVLGRLRKSHELRPLSVDCVPRGTQRGAAATGDGGERGERGAHPGLSPALRRCWSPASPRSGRRWRPSRVTLRGQACLRAEAAGPAPGLGWAPLTHYRGTGLHYLAELLWSWS